MNQFRLDLLTVNSSCLQYTFSKAVNGQNKKGKLIKYATTFLFFKKICTLYCVVTNLQQQDANQMKQHE